MAFLVLLICLPHVGHTITVNIIREIGTIAHAAYQFDQLLRCQVRTCLPQASHHATHDGRRERSTVCPSLVSIRADDVCTQADSNDIRFHPIVRRIANGRKRCQYGSLVHGSHGQHIVCIARRGYLLPRTEPEFPALHTSTIPLSATIEAWRDINAYWPSKSRYL